MNEEKIGVDVILTQYFSNADGVVAKIVDPVNHTEHFIEYSGVGAYEIVKDLLIGGIEIKAVYLYMGGKSLVGLQSLIYEVAKLQNSILPIPVYAMDRSINPFEGYQPSNH